MFTGLVEEVGKISGKIKAGDGFIFKITAQKVIDDLEIGSSIAVNGCCLTVVEKNKDTFAVDTIEDKYR
jgi:riboflavin synthase